MSFEKWVPDEAAMIVVGKTLSKRCTPPAVIFLQGDLGAGKTTLSRGFLRGLGYEGIVKSPTYTLVETYEFEKVTVHHFDFYRLNAVEELDYLGLEDYFTNDAVCLIEWPEKVSTRLPKPTLTIDILPKNQGRQLHFTGDKNYWATLCD